MPGKFIDATLRLIDHFTGPMQNAMNQMAQSSKKYMQYGKEIEKAGKSISSAGAAVTKGVTLPLGGLATAAISTAANFEAGMSKVQSISSASASEMDALTEKAKEMGKKTKFSATESADAFSYMAMAGWKTEEMLEGIEGIMYLAGASGEDLALTSDIVTDALTAFGMTAQDTGRFVDVLAKASSNSNTNVSMMGETFKYVAPSAGALGYTVEDTAVAIGLMANSGIKASQAGTSLNNWLTRMAKPTKESKIAMKALGISLTDSEGRMKEFSEVMRDARKGFAELTTIEKESYAAMLAGKTGMNGLLAVVNATDSDFEKLATAIDNANGSAKSMYDIANDNLIGRLTILSSTLESIAIQFGERLMPYVESGVGKLQELADAFSALSDEQVDQIIKWGATAAVVGPAIFVFGKMVGTVGSVVKAFGTAGKGLKTFSGNATKAKAIFSTIKFPFPKLPQWLKTGAGNVFSKLGSGVGKVISPIKNFGGAIGGLLSRSKLLQTVGKGLGKYFGGFGKIIGKLFSPFAKIGGAFGTAGKALFTLLGPANSAILVVGGLIAVGVLLYKNWDKVKESAGKLKEFIGNVLSAIGLNTDTMKEKVSGVGAKFTEMAGKASELWEVCSPVFGKIGEIAKTVFQIILGGAIGAGIGFLGSFLDSAASIFSGVITAADGLISFLLGAFTGNWESAWNGVKDIFGGVFEALVGLVKTPLNSVIGLINGAIAGINKIGVSIPDWVPEEYGGGKSFSINLPQVPLLYRGTNNWGGGPAMIHDKGAEIVDLPSGTRVYPHDKSLAMAREEGRKVNHSIVIQKIAEKIEIHKTADVDEVMDRFIKRLEEAELNIA